MENNKHYSPDNPSGLPRITPEVIEAFKNFPHDFEEQFARLKHSHPEIAQLLLSQAEIEASDNMENKQAFAKGWLALYSIISQQYEVGELESLFHIGDTDSDDDESLLA